MKNRERIKRVSVVMGVIGLLIMQSPVAFSQTLQDLKERQNQRGNAKEDVHSQGPVRERVSQPRAEQPRVEAPRIEQPRQEQPRVETPRIEQPRQEQPRVEQPRIEKPRVEQPQGAPSRIEQPRAGKPRVEQPRIEKPRQEQPRIERNNGLRRENQNERVEIRHDDRRLRERHDLNHGSTIHRYPYYHYRHPRRSSFFFSPLISIVFGTIHFYYDEGIFYERSGFYYVPVAAPIGIVISAIPAGHTVVLVGGVTYYCYDDIYYIREPRGYVVVANPYITSGQDSFTINIPNDNGSYTAVTLTKSGDGFIGPQGEYYTEFPSIEQLKVMYGK